MAAFIGRREFITLLGGAAVGVAAGGAGAAERRVPTVGFFSPNTHSAAGAWTAAFVKRLREVGWIEGSTIAIEFRWGEGHGDRTDEIIAEFVRLKPDVIVTHGQRNIVAARQATSTIPIVFALATDPVASRIRSQFGATGRQRYWPLDPGNRPCR